MLTQVSTVDELQLEDRGHEWIAPAGMPHPRTYLRPMRGQSFGKRSFGVRKVLVPRRWAAVVRADTHATVAYVQVEP